VKKRWWLLIFGVIALGFLGWAILPRIMTTQSDVSETDQGVTVLVAPPRIGAIERVLSTPGTLTASKTIRITSKVPGRIERILVEDGQPVAEGELLVQIEEETARLQVEQAYATWQAAQAQYDKARRGVRQEELENARALYEKAEKDLAAVEESFTRSEKLYKSGTIAKAQFEQAEASLRAARTELENAGRSLQMLEQGASPEERQMARSQAAAAKANYELARLQVEFTRIKAPESGVIARVLQDEGNIVGTSTPILVLVKDDQIQVEIEVAEKYYGEILLGGKLLEARILPVAYPGSDLFRGWILTVAPTIDPASRTFIVTVDIEDQKDLLRPGMYAEVEIVLERVPDALLVPASAVLDRAGEKTVFVVEGTGDAAVAAARGVVPGLSDANEVQILSGIDPGDNVIVEGNTFLEHGQRISVLEGE
jgi:HlyD family secretion protein